VAALAEKSVLIGASDRMLTAGDVEFEPEQSKIWLISPSICALIAGDAGVQAELFKRVHTQVIDWIVADPKT
jgi:20S proteasome alpha/beta subunit